LATAKPDPITDPSGKELWQTNASSEISTDSESVESRSEKLAPKSIDMPTTITEKMQLIMVSF
jgi:hypothetical protein